MAIKRIKFSKKPALIIIILLIFGVAAYLAWPHYQTHTKRVQVVKSYNYTYSRLDSYTVSGAKGTGITFQKPVEFKSTLATTQAPIADLTHYFGKNQLQIADLTAASQPTTPVNNQPASSFGAILSNPKNPNYGAVLAPLEQKVKQRLLNLDISFSDAQPLRTPNLNNAWQLNFTSTESSKLKNANLPTKKGVAILAVGQTNTYYFMLDAVSNNWDANQPIWQKIINSLGIDQ